MQRRLRQRTVKPSTLEDERLTAVPFGLRWFALLLQFWADDFGRAELLPRQMVKKLFPRDPQVTPERVEELVLELDAVGYLLVYADEDGRTLFQISQDLLGTVDKRGEDNFPPPPEPTGFANRFANRGLGERGSGRERARERVRFEGEGERESVRLPPSPFCSAHPAGTDDPCAHCGTARNRSKRWELLDRAGRDNSHLEVGDDFDEWDLEAF